MALVTNIRYVPPSSCLRCTHWAPVSFIVLIALFFYNFPCWPQRGFFFILTLVMFAKIFWVCRRFFVFCIQMKCPLRQVQLSKIFRRLGAKVLLGGGKANWEAGLLFMLIASNLQSTLAWWASPPRWHILNLKVGIGAKRHSCWVAWIWA